MPKDAPIRHKVDTPTKVQGLPARSEIDDRYTWSLESVYKSDEAWETDFARVQEWIPELDSFKGRLSESADTLLQCLRTRDRILEAFGRLAVYAHLKRDEDTRAARYQGLSDRVARVSTTLGQKLAYVAPELIAMDAAQLEAFLSSSEDLALYRHHIGDIIRVREHTLTPREEEIVAMTGEMARGPYQIFSMLNNADLKFPTIEDSDGTPIEITKAGYYRLMEHPDRRVRKETFHAFFETYDRYRNTLAATLSSHVNRTLFYSRVRHYDSALDAALDGYNVPRTVFENLVGTVGDHLAPLHRYMGLRKRVLQLDQLQPYDTAVPLVPEADMKFEYDQAAGLVLSGLKPMGDDYVTVLHRFFDERWIDVYETEGKRSGGYSSGSYGTPPYILLNFNGTLDEVFTLAHELGHSMHSYLSHQTQPFVYSDYTIFVAEVASTASESLLLAHMLEQTTDRAQRLYLLNHWADQIRGTVYVQVMFAEFERSIYTRAEAGEPLTHETLSEMFHELFYRYHGPELAPNDLVGTGWSRIPHFYYNFYVYQYATGYAAASALAQRILQEGDAARTPYLDFLRSGGSDYSINLLQKAGVDMTKPNAVIDTLALFDRLIGEMEDLLHAT